MSDSLLERTKALRDEAFGAFSASPAYLAYKALDDAVAAMKGDAGGIARTTARNGYAPKSASVAHVDGAKRVSQPAAAEMILLERGVPTMGAEMLAELPSKGAPVSATNASVNFTSAMSKSGRFQSIRRDGKYYWWFKDKPLPAGWNEPEPGSFDDILGSDSSVSSSQEGGDGHGPATT